MTTNVIHLHGDKEASAFDETLINVGDGEANIVQQPDIWSVSQS